MFNMKGEVIGIVCNFFSQSGGFEGLGLRAGNARATFNDREILVGGDIILTVAGYEIAGDGADFDKIHARLSALRPGSKLIVKVLRGGKVIELSGEVEKK